MSEITCECSRHEFGSTVHHYCPFCRIERLLESNDSLHTRLTYAQGSAYLRDIQAEKIEARHDTCRNALDEIATGPWGETEMRNIATEALKKGDSHDNQNR